MITINKLSYSYPRQEPTLRGLSLHVEPGSIYGFLGPNGAGKSTTIRNLLGLLRPDSGTIKLFGQELRSNRRSCLARVGTLIEAPSLYPNLSAIDNLKIACDYRQVSQRRIPEVLDLVGLAEQARKSTHKYSMGMKQRLGLALALLHDPELLILDEPTNGLDPAGISDIRRLLLDLREVGKTIMLSSHLLPELEKTVTHLGILHQGNMLFEGPLSALKEAWATNFIVEVQTPQASLAAKALQLSEPDDTDVLKITLPGREAIPDLIRQLTKAGIDIYAVRPITGDLESHFLQLTK